MRILKWLAGLVLVLAIIFLAGGLVLPREVTVARSVQIDAPAVEIYPHIADLKANQAWSPWLGRDPEVQLIYGPVIEGAGATMSWSSQQRDVGSGTMEITKAVANEHLTTALDFGDMGTATATFDLKAAGAVTEVTWGFTSDLGRNPTARWMGLLLDRWVGGDYEQGLSNLKGLVEQ